MPLGFLLLVILAVESYDTYTQTKIEETEGYCKAPLVVVSNWTSAAHWFGTTEDQSSPFDTSLKRHSISGRHTAPHQENGGNGDSMALLHLQTNGEGQIRVLPKMWQALDEMLRCQLQAAGTVLRQLGLGEIFKFQCQKEEQSQQITTRSWTRTQRKGWQSRWKRQRHSRKIQGCEWETGGIPFDSHNSITVHSISEQPASYGAMEWRGQQRTSHHHDSSSYANCKCRIGSSSSQGLPESRSDASRSQGVDREDTGAGSAVSNSGLTCRDIQSWQGPKASYGNPGSQEDPQSSMVSTPQRIGRPLESPTSRFHGATGIPDREGEQSYQRYPSCQQGNTEPELQSSRCYRSRSLSPIGSGVQGRAQQGLGGRRSQKEAAQGLRGMCSNRRSADYRGHACPERWRGGRRSKAEKSEGNRTSRFRRLQSFSGCYYLIFGCASTCPLVNATRTKPFQVTFDPVVEAYDTLGCCAASYSFENASAFPFQDWNWEATAMTLSDCLPFVSGAADAAAWDSQRKATIWRFNTLSEAVGVPVKHLDPQDFDSDRWQSDDFPIEAHSHLRMLDLWYHDARIQSTVQELQQDRQRDLEPILIIDEWEALLEILASQIDNSEELTLIMHGLCQTDVGQRETQTTPDIEDIRFAVLRTWEDYFHPGVTGFLHIVKPQEDIVQNKLRIIVEMSGAGVTLPVRDVATLRRIHWNGVIDNDVLQTAAYHTPGYNNFELFAQTDLAHWCLAHHSYYCNVHIENQILLPMRPANLRQGSLIDIFVHHKEDSEDQDEATLLQQTRTTMQDSLSPHVNDLCCGEGENCTGIRELEDWGNEQIVFMQRAVPTRSPSLSQIRLHGLHCHLATILIDRDQPLMEAVADSWPYGNRQHDTVVALHSVEHPPAFQSGQDPMYLVEHQDDYFEQIHTDDILALITISFESPTQKKQKIRTLWCPHKATRIDMLHFLRIVWYCRRPNLICFLYWNGRLWPESDHALRTLVAGDHLRLVMRSDGPEWCDIEFSEGTSRDYRVYESSPENVPQQQEQEEQSLPSTYSIRSRSRERSPRSGHREEDSDSLLQLPNHHDMVSLLQISARLSGSSFHESSQEIANPHVSDRWCERQWYAGSSTDPEPWTELEQGEKSTSCQQTWSFKQIIHLFEDFDSNFSLPCFSFPEDWPWKGPELQWKDLPFYDPGQPCDELVVYTDGSAGKETAGAAAVIYCRTYFGWSFGGALSLQLPSETSFCAEQWGTIIAAKAIYDHLKIQEACQRDKPRCTILFDSQSAGYTATGHWGVKGDSRLQRIVRSISHLVFQRFGVTINGEHVAAHRGDPGNEFADNVAEQARQGNVVGSGATGLWHLAQTMDIKHWEWLWFLCKRDPNLSWSGDQLTVSYHLSRPGDPETVLNLHHIQGQAEVPTAHQHRLGILDLTTATANVLTLKAGTKEDRLGLQGSTRQQVVYKQFHEQGIHVVAIQESRLRQTGKTANPWYIVRQADANQNGCYGVQLLFHKTLPIGHSVDDEDHTFNFKEEEIRYVARDPRYLIVKVNNPLLRAIVIAAHAPHRGAPEQEIANFWHTISCAIPKNCESWDKIVLTDANAHLGTIPTAAVGAHQAEEEDDKSAHFHNFLVEHGLWLPSTFEETQDGEGGTWWNDRAKKWQRNDYIAIGQGWKGFCRASVNEDIDLSLCKDDHRVAQLRSVNYVHLHTTTKKTSRRWDAMALAQWATSLTPTSIPQLDSWTLDVHSHAQALESTFEWHLHQHVRQSMQTRRKTHLSEETWSYVLQKRTHRRFLAEANNHDRLTRLRLIFTAWRDHHGPSGYAGVTTILKHLDHLVAGALQCFQQSGREVTRRIRKDDNKHYQDIAEEAGLR